MCTFGDRMQEGCAAVAELEGLASNLRGSIDAAAMLSEPMRQGAWDALLRTKCFLMNFRLDGTVDVSGKEACEALIDYDTDVGALDYRDEEVASLDGNRAYLSCMLGQNVTFSGFQWQLGATADDYALRHHATHSFDPRMGFKPFVSCEGFDEGHGAQERVGGHRRGTKCVDEMEGGAARVMEVSRSVSRAPADPADSEQTAGAYRLCAGVGDNAYGIDGYTTEDDEASCRRQCSKRTCCRSATFFPHDGAVHAWRGRCYVFTSSDCGVMMTYLDYDGYGAVTWLREVEYRTRTVAMGKWGLAEHDQTCTAACTDLQATCSYDITHRHFRDISSRDGLAGVVAALGGRCRDFTDRVDQGPGGSGPATMPIIWDNGTCTGGDAREPTNFTCDRTVPSLALGRGQPWIGGEDETGKHLCMCVREYAGPGCALTEYGCCDDNQTAKLSHEGLNCG
jgi:hypothetical protein